MAFDNVTFFELHVDDVPFGTGSADGDEEETEYETADSDGGGGSRLPLVVLLAVVGVAAVIAVRKVRGGDDESLQTEEVEPGVERVEA